jgi:hypothetical protein
VELANWEKQDLLTFAIRGGRSRIRALTDWYEIDIVPNNRSRKEIIEDTAPEKSLAKTMRALSGGSIKRYRLQELCSQVSIFYSSFCNIHSIERNKIIKAILDSTAQISKPPQKYTDVMPVEKVLEWIRQRGDNSSLPRYELYRKFIVSLQIACIARSADIFHIQFNTMERDHPPGSITFITTTKTSKGRGTYFYLFEIPTQPSMCPVQTTLALKKSWEEERKIKNWTFPEETIHVDPNGKRLSRPDQIAAILREIHREAGIDTSKWKPNNARHAVITFYKARGVNESQIKLITGHSLKSTVTQNFYTLPLTDWANKSILSSTNTSPSNQIQTISENAQPQEEGLIIKEPERPLLNLTSSTSKVDDTQKKKSRMRKPEEGDEEKVWSRSKVKVKPKTMEGEYRREPRSHKLPPRYNTEEWVVSQRSLPIQTETIPIQKINMTDVDLEMETHASPLSDNHGSTAPEQPTQSIASPVHVKN